jgi:hypothetical protein
MTSSNKVVLVQKAAIGAIENAVQVFDNRKVLTTWLWNNVNLTNDNGDKITDDGTLRDAVDTSFRDGTPLQFNPNYTVVKWISGTVEGGNVLVKKILRFDRSATDLKLEPFAPTAMVPNESLAEAFKMKQEELERARVVSSVEPFGDAAKAGFHVGDILLQSKGQKTELLLASEKHPYQVDLSFLDQGIIFVVRPMPPMIATTSPFPKSAFLDPRPEFETDLPVEESNENANQTKPVEPNVATTAANNNDNKATKTSTKSSSTGKPSASTNDPKWTVVEDDENQAEPVRSTVPIKKKTAKAPTKSSSTIVRSKSLGSLRGKVGEQRAQYQVPTHAQRSKGRRIVIARRVVKADTSVDATRDELGKRAQYQVPTHAQRSKGRSDTRVDATRDELGKRAQYQVPTHAQRSKGHRIVRARRVVKAGQMDIDTRVDATRDELAKLTIGDENSKPKDNCPMVDSESVLKDRIVELEAEVAFLKQKLGEVEKIDG